MRRRDIIALIGAGVMAWPLPARPQQTAHGVAQAGMVWHISYIEEIIAGNMRDTD